MSRRRRSIGGGLAGCEARGRLRAARRRASSCTRCGRTSSGPAHHTGDAGRARVQQLAARRRARERGRLLKEELARLDSLIVTSAREAAVPAGGALAVDRERFCALVESRLGGAAERRDSCAKRSPRFRTTGIVIVACGPLPSDALARRDRRARRSAGALHYYDAASPIVAPIDRHDARCTASRATIRATATTTSTFRSIARQYAAVRRRPARRCRSTIRKEFEADAAAGKRAVFRGLSADRRDGRARRRHAALRAAQAGRAARSAHRQDAVRGRAAAQGERRRHARSTWSAFRRG